MQISHTWSLYIAYTFADKHCEKKYSTGLVALRYPKPQCNIATFTQIAQICSLYEFESGSRYFDSSVPFQLGNCT